MANLVKGTITKGKVTCDFYLTRKDVPGQLCVEYTINCKPGVPLHKGSFCVDMVAIANAVKDTINAQGPVGWSWKSEKKKVGKVANRAAVAQTVYPPLGVPMSVAVKASQMYHAAQAGDPEAREQIYSIIRAGQEGDPKAQKIAQAFAVFSKASAAGHSVSGWADNIKRGWWANIPYRGNFAAGAFDKTNPSHVARKLHSINLDAIARGQR